MPDIPQIVVQFPNQILFGSAGGGGVTDHGALTGLADDDHAQYHNDARGDARYVRKDSAASLSSLDVGTLRIAIGNGQWARLVPIIEDGRLTFEPVAES